MPKRPGWYSSPECAGEARLFVDRRSSVLSRHEEKRWTDLILKALEPEDAPSDAKPIPWDAYRNHALTEWAELLAADTLERPVQEFLEKNPAFLPGVNEYNSGHHSPLGGVLYSQPTLQNISKNRQPDFMWLGKTSAELTPVLIEIEAPKRKWFTETGNSTALFTHAHGQLSEWKAWFTHPQNQVFFRERYYVWPAGIDERLPMNPKYILIYGRRSEFDADVTGELIRRRSTLPRANEVLMTFDRLTPREALADVATVRLRKDGRMKVIGIPSSYTTGPLTGETSLRTGPADAPIDAVPLWSPQRKEWVKGRWQHWANEELKRQHHGRPVSLLLGEWRVSDLTSTHPLARHARHRRWRPRRQIPRNNQKPDSIARSCCGSLGAKCGHERTPATRSVSA